MPRKYYKRTPVTKPSKKRSMKTNFKAKLGGITRSRIGNRKRK